MLAVLRVKFRLLKRKPWSFITMTVILLAFSYVMGMNYGGKIEVPVFSELTKQQLKPIVQKLNASNTFHFSPEDKEDALEAVNDSKSEMAVELKSKGATIFIIAEGENFSLLNYELNKGYQDLGRTDAIMEQVQTKTPEEAAELKKDLSKLEDQTPFEVEKKGFMAKDAFRDDSGLQALFGFGLFFVIFTISFNVVTILTEKQNGIWNRLLLSPLRKWQLYAGNLAYSFITGYIQMALVFCIFRFVLQYQFYGAFGKTLIILIPYTFCIIAIALLIAALVKNLQQFRAVVPFLAVSMAMLGGAYWPLEIVTSKTILLLSKIVPITYGMQALKGATIYGQSWSALLYPMGILFLMGAVLLGIGIKVIDRK
ncbi:ABC transporter permease [Bacillus sp. 1P06AnD]|uniref:ABC transporter permease n=1 Tax=Bacillus sp. 1P06AnD TaxID=3132208 RepID=UPI0039A1FAA0